MYVVKPDDGQGRERVLHRDMLLPCGFLPVPLTKDVAKEVAQTSPRAASGVANEEECAENVPFVEEDADGGLQDLIPGVPEQASPQTLGSLNPDAPVFVAHQADLSDMSVEVSPAQSLARPQRRRAPPKYLADYKLGFGRQCSDQGPSALHTLFHGFLLSLQQQVAGLVESLAGDGDGDVPF